MNCVHVVYECHIIKTYTLRGLGDPQVPTLIFNSQLILLHIVGFEVLTAVSMKMAVFLLHIVTGSIVCRCIPHILEFNAQFPPPPFI
jgi:hypothetical protein